MTSHTKLLTTKQAAEFLGFSPATLEGWRTHSSKGPVFIKLDYAVRYKESDLVAWLEGRSRHSTSEYPTCKNPDRTATA